MLCVQDSVIFAFQFTPLREGRRLDFALVGLREHFNSRPSARGDGTTTLFAASTCRIFQFTPLREGRLYIDFLVYMIVVISIHAPPRGATQWLLTIWSWGNISIHAPPRGATAMVVDNLVMGKYFNSRPSARGDVAGLSLTAPRTYFNSRPSARGDSYTR